MSSVYFLALIQPTRLPPCHTPAQPLQNLTHFRCIKYYSSESFASERCWKCRTVNKSPQRPHALLILPMGTTEGNLNSLLFHIATTIQPARHCVNRFFENNFHPSQPFSSTMIIAFDLPSASQGASISCHRYRSHASRLSSSTLKLFASDCHSSGFTIIRSTSCLKIATSHGPTKPATTASRVEPTVTPTGV